MSDDLMIRREAFENLMAWVAEAQHLRIILQDLIVELRNISSGWEYKASSIMSLDNAAYQIQPLLDRAEKQLKELTNE